MRRRRYQPQIKKNSTFGLNINSMTDMFTIMLVFLLQTYSTAQVQVNPESGITLPSSNSMANLVQGVKISVTPDAIKLDEKVIASMKGQVVDMKDVDQKDPNFIVPLFHELDRLAKDDTKQELKEGKVLLQADASLPYETLRKVMYTASMAGFPQLKLVTMVGN